MKLEPRSLFRRLYYWANERLYHEAAWTYDFVAWLVSFGRWDAWRRQVMGYVVGERVLELGFGTGHLLMEAASRGLEVWGVDPSPEMQRIAARRIRRHGLIVRRMRARAQSLPFADRAFDTVISTFPTPYVFEPATLRAVWRLLRSSAGSGPGRFLITGIGVMAKRTPLQWATELAFGGRRGGAETEMTIGRYLDRAEACGFVVSVVDEGAAGVSVPVFILEREG